MQRDGWRTAESPQLGCEDSAIAMPAVGAVALRADLGTQRNARIRVDTVHKAKGESLEAVLYMATREHIDAMLDGVGTELGRIGYVAVTRAKNLLWLGVPAAALPSLRQRLVDAGFREVGAV